MECFDLITAVVRDDSFPWFFMFQMGWVWEAVRIGLTGYLMWEQEQQRKKAKKDAKKSQAEYEAWLAEQPTGGGGSEPVYFEPGGLSVGRTPSNEIILFGEERPAVASMTEGDGPRNKYLPSGWSTFPYSRIA